MGGLQIVAKFDVEVSVVVAEREGVVLLVLRTLPRTRVGLRSKS